MKRLLVAERIWGSRDAGAILVDGSRIEAVGSEEMLRGSADDIVRLDGELLPGLTDHHIHPNALASLANSAPLAEASDFASIVELFEESGAVMGSGLDETALAEGRLPTADDLVSIQRPILLMRRCGHIAVGNRQALELAGIDSSTPDPPRGSIDRDEAGRPTGVVREAAVSLLTEALQGVAPAPSRQQLLGTLKGLLRLGVTRIHAIASTGSPLWCGAGREVDSLLAIAEESPIDIDLIVATTSIDDLRTTAALLPHGRIRFGGWKAFADGSLGGQTAAMSDEYRSGGRGMPTLPENARELGGAAVGLGGVAAIHAIGDRAVDAVLDLFDDLGGGPHLRIEHASFVSDAAIARMADLGIVASIQPAFRVSDRHLVADRLTPRAQEMAYRFGDMQAAGVSLVGGSDSPVEDPSPWETLEEAGVNDPLSLYATPSRPGDRADLVLRRDESTVAVWKDGLPQS